MAGECRWRPRKDQVDPWSRGREAARGVLTSSPKHGKRSTFCHRRGIEKFRYVFSTRHGPNVFVSDAWPAPATYHRSFCENYLWPESGSELVTSAPRLDFMAQSLVVSIDVCRWLGISPLRINIWLGFSRPILAQDLPTSNDFFRVFFQGLKLFISEDLCSWRVVRKSFGGYLWNSNFFWQHRVSIVTGLIHCCCFFAELECYEAHQFVCTLYSETIPFVPIFPHFPRQKAKRKKTGKSSSTTLP